MSNIPGTVANILKRFGKPCTVTRRATPQNPNSTTETTVIRISERNVYSFGQVQTVTQGLMPATDMDLQGAQVILASGKTYNIVSVDEKVNDGFVFMQKVTLGN